MFYGQYLNDETSLERHYIDINVDENIPIKEEEKAIQNFALQFLQCIKQKNTPPIIMIPISIRNTGYRIVDGNKFIWGHANLLIYRRDRKVFEHFEPYGEYTNDRMDNLIYNTVKQYVDAINRELPKEEKISYLFNDQTCPTIGIQRIEEEMHDDPDEFGYCLIWTMFFMELVLHLCTFKTPN
jgi:hypothetical protein